MRLLRRFAVLAFAAAVIPACVPGQPAPPGDYTHVHWPIHQLDAAGRRVARTYHVHIPLQAVSGAPLPVVINLHPAYNNGFLQNLYSGMNAKADREGFIAVHPDAIGPGWNVTPDLEAEDGGISDVEFIRLGLDELERRARIDPRRIFATGFSSGAAMAGRLAVASARGDLGTHRIAAIAPVSGPPWDGHSPLSVSSVFDAPELAADPVPMRMIVSNNDLTIATLYGATAAQVDAALRAVAAQYAANNGVLAPPRVTRTGARGWGVVVETRRWTSGDPRRETVLDVFDTGSPDRDGHVWPGPWFGGAFSATDAVWSFFAAHPRF